MTETNDDAGDWLAFVDALDLGAVVPPAFARYRPAVEDGFDFFLQNLSAPRAFALLADQALLPSAASPTERLVAIARACPALHKLGQVMARDRRLPVEFRGLLQGLETMASDLEVDGARALVEAELGPLHDLGLCIDAPPLAEASVAVVVPFTRRDGGEGVCKLLKAGVEDKLAEDLDLLQRLGALLDERCEALSLPRIEYEETFAQVRTLLALEVRLDREQRHLRAAAVIHAADPLVDIPEVFAFSTPRLTAMRRVRGVKVTDVAALPAERRLRLAERIVSALVAQPLWSEEPQAMFHADPHAGNLIAGDDGSLAVLDWSLVGYLEKSDRVCLVQILVGALVLDGERIARSIAGLASGGIDRAALDQVVDRHLAAVRDGAWPGFDWLTGLLDDTALRARGRFGTDLVMFRKVLQTLDGVVADVSEACRPDRVLIAAMLRELAAESAGRAMQPPFSRASVTHLSNADLGHLLASVPLIGLRQYLALQARALQTGARPPRR